MKPSRRALRRRTTWCALTAAAFLIGAGPFAGIHSARAEAPPPPPAPGGSAAFGATLAEWQEIYWRWAWFGQDAVPVDANGNAVVGNVVLMPLPNAPGDGAPGSIDVTLDAGQAFVLPLWNIFGTSYDDGTPTDPNLDPSVFQTLDIALRVDGVTALSTANVMNYYSGFALDPAIPLPDDWSPYEALVWVQGVGVVQPPLSAAKGGGHTITLDVVNTLPVVDGQGGEYYFEYHNTWNVTVNPGK